MSIVSSGGLAAGVLGEASLDDRFAKLLGADELEIEWMALPENCSKEPDEGRLIDTILVHFCSDVVANPASPYGTKKIVDGFAGYGVSAHFLIDRAGLVYQLVSLDRTAYHAGVGQVEGMLERTNRLNEYSIGVELMGIGSVEDMSIYINEAQYRELAETHLGYTEEQYASLRIVIGALREIFEEIDFSRQAIFGHDEWSPGRKTDPGELFDWEKIGLSR